MRKEKVEGTEEICWPVREVQSFVCGVSDAERKHRYIVLVARHWIRLTEIADIRLYERSSIYRLHRRNLICNREFLIQPLTAKSILQLDWVINYYRLYNAVSLFFSFFSTSSSYLLSFCSQLCFLFFFTFYFAFFQLDNENKKECTFSYFLGITSFSQNYYKPSESRFVFFRSFYLDHVNKFPLFYCLTYFFRFHSSL